MNNSIILPEKTVQFNGRVLLTVDQELANCRLDRYIALKTTTFSRSFIQKMIAQGNVLINERIALKANTVVKYGDAVIMETPAPFVAAAKDIEAAHEKINILYEHEHFFIIDKPAGMLVHKTGLFSKEVTVVDWLMGYRLISHNTGDSMRPGIVHRLDKDTSGLLIIAKTSYGHAYIAQLFQDRLVKKTYTAIVHGSAPLSGSIDLYIGRDPVTKSRMSTSRVKNDHTFRSALTHFKTVVSNHGASLIEAYPVTGRTHQIRVHLQSIGHPLLGDVLYNPVKRSVGVRHALHASALSFVFEGVPVSITSDLPDDLKQLCVTYQL